MSKINVWYMKETKLNAAITHNPPKRKVDKLLCKCSSRENIHCSVSAAPQRTASDDDDAQLGGDPPFKADTPPCLALWIGLNRAVLRSLEHCVAEQA
jgi:hypothetical protein